MQEAHLFSKRKATICQEDTRLFPLHIDPSKFNGANEIIEYLDVERSSRYQKTKSSLSNIYAHDFARLMGAYIPRVFWTESAIKNQSVDVSLGNTVVEMNVNMLYKWFQYYSNQFGWEPCKNTTEAQRMSNQGDLVIMIAAAKDPKKLGHISVVVPETESHKSIGARGIVIYPLQSQAGDRNCSRFSDKWWGKGYDPIMIYTWKELI